MKLKYIFPKATPNPRLKDLFQDGYSHIPHTKSQAIALKVGEVHLCSKVHQVLFPHSIHGTGIFTYIYHILPLKNSTIHVGKISIYHTWMVWVLYDPYIPPESVNKRQDRLSSERMTLVVAMGFLKLHVHPRKLTWFT